MIRLHVVAEGQTEEAFINRMLVDHFAHYQVFTDVRCVATGKRRGRVFKGGIVSYAKFKRDVVLWTKEDGNSDSRFTTMIDYYALPTDFPGYKEATQIVDKYDRVKTLEKNIKDDIGDWRFFPYIQTHEYEALLYANLEIFRNYFLGDSDINNKILTLERALIGAGGNPELINDSQETAPSKRILKVFEGYGKTTAGVEIAEGIGLNVLRQKCLHFNEWIVALEGLANPDDES